MFCLNISPMKKYLKTLLKFNSDPQLANSIITLTLLLLLLFYYLGAWTTQSFDSLLKTKAEFYLLLGD